jgi:hypothetical protein
MLIVLQGVVFVYCRRERWNRDTPERIASMMSLTMASSVASWGMFLLLQASLFFR